MSIDLIPRILKLAAGRSVEVQQQQVDAVDITASLITACVISSMPAADVIDQEEVMRAMLAQAAAKRGAEGSDSGSDSGSDAGSDDESDIGSDAGSDAGSDNSQFDAEEAKDSSSSHSRSSSPAPAPARSAVATTSRVKLPPRTDVKGKAPTSTADDIFEAPRATASASFESLGLSAPITNALASINIRKPTEIQVACVPPILSGRDCIGGAKTGSGKTLAFALPILESIARDPTGLAAVVLTPTRELAYQLSEQFLAIGRPLGLSTATIVGGMDMLTQAQELERRPHVVVATPGRLCDLLRSGGSGPGNKLARVRTLVLDEADRMLTPTFAPELGYLFSLIPKNRQTLLFTATISDAIMDLAKKPPPPGKQKPFVYRVASE
jgi:ATP-dependent RNA helicase DDX49/DBP8